MNQNVYIVNLPYALIISGKLEEDTLEVLLKLLVKRSVKVLSLSKVQVMGYGLN